MGGEYRGKKILLVEDDLYLRDCFERLLEFDGHEVHAVDSGPQALARLKRESFDLVITDYLMPELNGDELAGMIKQQCPGLPVVLASESLQSVGIYYSFTPGVDSLLNKPFTMNELREAIIWALELHADSQITIPDTTALLGADSPPPSSEEMSSIEPSVPSWLSGPGNDGRSETQPPG